MATVSATISQNLSATHEATVGISTYKGTPTVSYSKSLSSSDISKVYNDRRSLTTNETLDVTSLTDAFGSSINFATVKGIQITNRSTTQTLTVGGSTNPLFNQLPVISAGGSVSFCLNITTSGSVKNILLTASGSLSYDIIIVGS